MWHEIDGGFVFRVVQVDRRRRDLVADGQDAEHRLDGAGGAQKVPGHRLGRGHGHVFRMIADQPLDRAQLDPVGHGRGAVGVDVVDVLDRDPGPFHRRLHGAIGAVAVLGRGGDVPGVARHAVADDLGVDLRAARPGVFVFLEDDDPGALAHDEAGMAPVIGARGLLRRVVIGGAQGLAGEEAGDTERHDGALGPARHHHIGIVQHDHPRRVANSVHAGGAGRHDGVVRPLQAVADRDLAAGQVDQGRGDEEGADAARTGFGQDRRAVGDGAQAAYAGPHDDAGAFLVLVRLGMPIGVVQSLVGRCDAEQDEVVDPLAFLGRHDGVGIKAAGDVGPAPAATVHARNLARDGAAEAFGIEGRDLSDAGTALEDAFPAQIDPVAQGRDKAETGDDDATHDVGLQLHES